MVTFTRSDELREAEFVGTDLSGARFVGANLSGVVMRGVDVQGADIDAPWLLEEGGGSLLVNSVDVAPFVEAELNRRFPGRSERRAADPEGLRAAWAALERAWAATLDRVAAMPAGTVDLPVGGEWSFAQTLRHLVLATDAWLGRAILGSEQPFHPMVWRTPAPRKTAWTCRSSQRSPRPTLRCSGPGRVASRWCATSSSASPPANWRRHDRIHGGSPNIPRPLSPACT
jgi:hypothetical protein